MLLNCVFSLPIEKTSNFKLLNHIVLCYYLGFVGEATELICHYFCRKCLLPSILALATHLKIPQWLIKRKHIMRMMPTEFIFKISLLWCLFKGFTNTQNLYTHIHIYELEIDILCKLYVIRNTYIEK